MVCMAGIIACRAAAVRRQEQERERKRKECAEAINSKSENNEEGAYTFKSLSRQGRVTTRTKWFKTRKEAAEYRDMLDKLYNYKTTHFFKE